MSATLPMPNERIYAPYKIAAIVEVLEEQGVPAECVLQGSGVEVGQLHDPAVLTSVQQFLTVCENAVSLSAEPSTPFDVGSRLHLSAYGMYGYALMSCLSLRDYFRIAVEYRRLATPPIHIEWSEAPGVVTWTLPGTFVSNPSERLRTFLIEMQYSLNVTHLQEVIGHKYQPLKACFTYDEPEYSDLYTRYLECPCLFNQPSLDLVYDSAILDQKPQMAHRLTSALLLETCDRLIGSAKFASGISGEIYHALMKRPGVFPSMETVAAQLNITARTLRRRLAAEGTSFQAILDDVRCSLALEYLKSTRMTTDDIAMLLGFSDSANFRRALKRWTGKTTEQVRA